MASEYSNVILIIFFFFSFCSCPSPLISSPLLPAVHLHLKKAPNFLENERLSFLYSDIELLLTPLCDPFFFVVSFPACADEWTNVYLLLRMSICCHGCMCTNLCLL